jgi:hypothetical protein
LVIDARARYGVSKVRFAVVRVVAESFERLVACPHSGFGAKKTADQVPVGGALPDQRVANLGRHPGGSRTQFRSPSLDDSLSILHAWDPPGSRALDRFGRAPPG